MSDETRERLAAEVQEAIGDLDRWCSTERWEAIQAVLAAVREAIGEHCTEAEPETHLPGSVPGVLIGIVNAYVVLDQLEEREAESPSPEPSGSEVERLLKAARHVYRECESLDDDAMDAWWQVPKVAIRRLMEAAVAIEPWRSADADAPPEPESED